MFEQATLSGGPLSTRLWSTCAGLTGQMFLVGTMLLVPLFFPSTLPNLRNAITIAPPGPPPPPPSPPPGEITIRPRLTHASRICSVCVPVTVPKGVRIVVDDPPAFTAGGGVQGGVAGGTGDGSGNSNLLGAIMDNVRWTPPPPPPAVAVHNPAPPPPPQVVRATSGGVQLGAPIRKIEPPYPPLARTARVEGVVELEALVGVDGRVKELTLKSGPALLVKAAMDAVRQWVYAPTTLNGKPVEVISPITVTFRLGR